MQMKYNSITMLCTKKYVFSSTRVPLNGVQIARTTTLLLRLQQGSLLLIQLCRWSWCGQKYLQVSEELQDGEIILQFLKKSPMSMLQIIRFSSAVSDPEEFPLINIILCQIVFFSLSLIFIFFSVHSFPQNLVHFCLQENCLK